MIRINKENLFRPYILVNLILLIIILLIFLYSIIFTSEKLNYPVKSNYTLLTGKSSISTGLSRSFSEIIRFNLDKAKAYNPYGIGIFLFFLIQLILRIGITFVLHFFPLKNKLILYSDIFLSLALFLFFFWPFLKEMFTVFL